MTVIEYLNSLEWNDFSTYPRQDACIYLKCVRDGEPWYFKVNHFNAKNFEVKRVHKDLDFSVNWEYHWLPAHEVDVELNKLRDNAKQTN